MKTILCFDAVNPRARPLRLTLPDTIASAFVRSGIAAAADPAEAGALSSGEVLSAATPTLITIESGLPGLSQMIRLNVPLAAAQIAIGAGNAAAIAVQVTGTTLPTLGPITAAFNAGSAAGTLIAMITGVPAGATPTFLPADGRVVVAGDALSGWKLVAGASAASAGTITGTISAAGATGTSIVITVGNAAVPALSASSALESAASGDLVGQLSVSGVVPVTAWALTDDAGGRFRISGGKRDQLVVNWTQFDRAIATSHSVTAQATLADGSTTTASFTIAIAAATDPSQLAAPPILALDARKGVTASAGAISAVAAPWSATGGGLTGASGKLPVLASGYGPAAQDAINFSAGQNFTFTATAALTTFDLNWVIAPTDTADLYLAGGSSNTANIIRLQRSAATGAYDRCNVIWGDAVSTSITLSKLVYDGHFHAVRVTYDAAGGSNNVKVYVDGVLSGNGTAATKTLTLGKIGTAGTVAATANWYLTAFAWYASVLGTGDAASLLAAFEPFRRQRIYVSASGGSDSSLTPWLNNGAAAYQSIAKGWSAAFRPGDTMSLKRGDTFVKDYISAAIQPVGTAANPVRISSYGAGANPIHMFGDDLAAATWTNAGTDLWTTPLASSASPALLFQLSGNIASVDFSLASAKSRIIPIDTGGTPAAWTFSWSANVLTLKTASGVNPNGLKLYATGIATQGGMSSTQPGILVIDQEFRLAGAVGATLAGDGSAWWRCKTVLSADDGFDFKTSGGGTVNAFECEAYHNGPIAGISATSGAGAGDGYSYHLAMFGLLWRCIAKHNTCGGWRSLEGQQVTADGCLFEGNAYDVLQLTAGTLANGKMNLLNSVVIVTAASASGNGYDVNSGTTSTFSGKVAGNTIVSKTGLGVGINMSSSTAGASIVANDNIVTGFATGMSGSLITEDYNNIWACTTLRTGITAGAHSVSVDPLFANAATNDFYPRAASPMKGAGTPVTGMTLDYDQIPRATPPAIGAYEGTEAWRLAS